MTVSVSMAPQSDLLRFWVYVRYSIQSSGPRSPSITIFTGVKLVSQLKT